MSDEYERPAKYVQTYIATASVKPGCLGRASAKSGRGRLTPTTVRRNAAENPTARAPVRWQTMATPTVHFRRLSAEKIPGRLAEVRALQISSLGALPIDQVIANQRWIELLLAERPANQPSARSTSAQWEVQRSSISCSSTLNALTEVWISTRVSTSDSASSARLAPNSITPSCSYPV